MKDTLTGKTVTRVISVIGTISGGVMFGLGFIKREPGLMICGGIISLANVRFFGTTLETKENN